MDASVRQTDAQKIVILLFKYQSPKKRTDSQGLNLDVLNRQQA
jgi:hypothetical protein